MFLVHISDYGDSTFLCKFAKIFAYYAAPIYANCNIDDNVCTVFILLYLARETVRFLVVFINIYSILCYIIVSTTIVSTNDNMFELYSNYYFDNDTHINAHFFREAYTIM